MAKKGQRKQIPLARLLHKGNKRPDVNRKGNHSSKKSELRGNK